MRRGSASISRLVPQHLLGSARSLQLTRMSKWNAPGTHSGNTGMYASPPSVRLHSSRNGLIYEFQTTGGIVLGSASVSGSVSDPAHGRLGITAAGADKKADRARPLLEASSREIAVGSREPQQAFAMKQGPWPASSLLHFFTFPLPHSQANWPRVRPACVLPSSLASLPPCPPSHRQAIHARPSEAAGSFRPYPHTPCPTLCIFGSALLLTGVERIV